jgi:anti-anti-sigma factor
MADDALRELERRVQQTGDRDAAERLRAAHRRAARAPALVIDLRLELVAAPVDGRPDLSVTAAGWDRVAVDLSRRPYMSSFVLAGLIELRDHLQGRDGELVVCTSDARVLVVFDMLGVSDLLPRSPSVEDALRERGWTAAETVVLPWRIFD